MSQEIEQQHSKEVQDIEQNINEDDILRILVTSDNHLGFGERDRVRRDDSFVTFEEILKIATERKVCRWRH